MSELILPPGTEPTAPAEPTEHFLLVADELGIRQIEYPADTQFVVRVLLSAGLHITSNMVDSTTGEKPKVSKFFRDLGDIAEEIEVKVGSINETTEVANAQPI